MSYLDFIDWDAKTNFSFPKMASFAALPAELQSKIIRLYIEDVIYSMPDDEEISYDDYSTYTDALCRYKARIQIAPFAFASREILEAVLRILRVIDQQDVYMSCESSDNPAWAEIQTYFGAMLSALCAGKHLAD